MSMKMLTIYQTIEIFAAYAFVTVLLPCLIFRKKVQHQRLSVRFMIYLVIGNFYIINLVFLLQLLHVSNRWTLLVFTFVPLLLALLKVYHVPVKAVLKIEFTYIKRLTGGQLGIKTCLRKVGAWLFRQLKGFFIWLKDIICEHIVDWILVIGLTIILVWIYGSNLLTTYGYCASDIPVHNFWINYMGKNQIFVDGVYPFGYHCMIYYLHELFDFDTYVLLRLFCLTQMLVIHFVLLAFVKACCKSKFAAYAGVGIYAAGGIYNISTYARYYSTLPQEYGMIFILPSIYFLFEFFRTKQMEDKDYKRTKISKYYLWGFVMSFSLTLAVHFYDTMIAGLFCLGIAIGYGFLFFKKEYFRKVMLAGIISVGIAILPMGAAYAMGTPLQGSLNWGMNVLLGDRAKQEETQPQEESSKEKVEQEESAGQSIEENIPEQVYLYEDMLQEYGKYLKSTIRDGTKYKVITTFEYMDTFVALDKNPILRYVILGCMVLLILLSILFFCIKQRDYAAKLLSTAFFMLFMTLLLAAAGIGLPEFMDASRCSIFYTYMLPVMWGFCLDGVLYLILGWFHRTWMLHTVSFILILAAGVVFVVKGSVKEPMILFGLESNEAVTCLTNIIHDNEDFTWTICSANDELRMGEDHGYHYETIDLLRKMEYSGPTSNITLPTHYVYFFIEKVPLDYTVAYVGSGQKVSEEGARKELPNGSGLGMYEGENRWIVMSRLYYWAQSFQKMYPNEMRVYYETDNFICYRIEQNDYSLYNFAIDYGYNVKPQIEE